MKNLFLITVILALLGGCAKDGSQSGDNTESELAPLVAEEASISTPVTLPDGRILEFLLCREGPDYTDESMRSLITDWNAAIDKLDDGAKIAASYGLRPNYESDMFDGIWALVWPDMDTRKAGWEIWPESGGNALQENYGSVLSCDDNTFIYSASTVVPLTSAWENEPPHDVSYHFCSWNDGFDQDDAETIESNIINWVNESRETYPNDGFVLHGLAPLFDSRNPDDNLDDFDVVGMWAYRSAEDAQKFSESWANSAQDIQSGIDRMLTCKEYNFDMYLLRLPGA